MTSFKEPLLWDDPTYSSSEAPASPSASQGDVLDWMIRVATWPSTPWELLTNLDPVGSSLRMCPAYCPLATDETLGFSSEWTVLDAQYRGLAQRRERVFAVGHLGDWRGPAAVLFEPTRLRGYSAPSRQTRKDVAGTLGSRATAGGGLGTDFELGGGLVQATTVGTQCAQGRPNRSFGQSAASGHLFPASQIVGTLSAHSGAPDENDAEQSRLIPDFCPAVSPAMKARDHKGVSSDGDGDGLPLIVTDSLRADGFDASEDGSGRATPIVPVIAATLTAGGTGERGHLDPVNGTLIAFSVKDHGADSGELSPTLRAGNHDTSHANGGVMPAVCISENQRGEVRVSDVAPSLNEGGGKPGQGYPAVFGLNHRQDPVSWANDVGPLDTSDSGSHAVSVALRGRNGGATAELGGDVSMALRSGGGGGGDKAHTLLQSGVRRLTPRECERLQGFPDDYTAVTYNKKPSADGPRYKAIGNSMAVPVVRWILERIEFVDNLKIGL